VRGAFGGFNGRGLRTGDALPVAASDAEQVFPHLAAKLRIGSPPFSTFDDPPKLPLAPSDSSPPAVRVMAGQQWDAFAPEARQSLCQAEFRLSPQSDRMGFRLEGPRLALREPLEMISEAVAFGTVQAPPDGNPIVLMADRQTTGGYPKIASVASVDLPILAQMRPRQGLRFALISLEEAQRLYMARERVIADIAKQVAALLRG